MHTSVDMGGPSCKILLSPKWLASLLGIVAVAGVYRHQQLSDKNEASITAVIPSLPSSSLSSELFVPTTASRKRLATSSSTQRPHGHSDNLAEAKSRLLMKHWQAPSKIQVNISQIPIIKNNSKDLTSQGEFLVPNIVHYTWYTEEPKYLRFIGYLGFMSAYKILRPDIVYFHLNIEPLGPYWQAIKKLTKVQVDRTEYPNTMLGKKLAPPIFYTDGSDIARVNCILNTGGIYLDLDVFVIKSFDPLRKFSCTMGYESPIKVGQLCGGIILAERNSTFMFKWAKEFSSHYKPKHWAFNSGRMPSFLSKRHPELIHIENDTLHMPSFDSVGLDMIWGNLTWDVQHNYALHTWYNLGLKYYRQRFDPNFNLDSIDDLRAMENCTFKRIAETIINLE